MGVGKYRIRAVFSQRDNTFDSIGAPSVVYTEVLTVGVSIVTLPGNERQAQDRIQSQDSYLTIECRYRSVLENINERSRVTIDGKDYEIVGVDRMNFRGQYLRFTIKEDRR